MSSGWAATRDSQGSSFFCRTTRMSASLSFDEASRLLLDAERLCRVDGHHVDERLRAAMSSPYMLR